MGPITETIVRKIEESCTNVEALCQDVPLRYLVEPSLPHGWSVKDTLGHLAAWVWRLTFELDVAPQTDASLLGHPDLDALNRRDYQERRDWPWVTINHDFHQAHESLISVIRTVPAVRLASPLVLEAIAQATWKHHSEHLADLAAWRQAHDDSQPWASEVSYPYQLAQSVRLR